MGIRVTVEQQAVPARDANELLAELARARARVAPLGFLCECSDDDCFRPVALDLDQYTALRHVWAPIRAHPTPPSIRHS
jgi:hypothetical protein